MNGLNDFAENVELREGLRKEFPASLIAKLPATSKRPALDYVGHASVTDRLNHEAPGWTYELTRFIEFTDANGLTHVMAVYGYMQIGSVKRWEVGEADGLAEYGRELKGAISDFIRRAAMRFGVALDLWSKEDLHDDHTKTVGGPPALAKSNARPGATSGQAARDAAPPSHQADRTRSDVQLSDQQAESVPAGEPTHGEGATPAGTPKYLSPDDQQVLGTEYGTKAKALIHYKKRYGNRLNSVADITYEMRDEMEAMTR